MEWDLLAGPMCSLILTLMLAYPTPCGDGVVAGEVAGGTAGVVGSAGAGLHLIGTLVVEGGKNMI